MVDARWSVASVLRYIRTARGGVCAHAPNVLAFRIRAIAAGLLLTLLYVSGTEGRQLTTKIKKLNVDFLTSFSKKTHTTHD